MIKSEKPYDFRGQVWRGIDDKFPKPIRNATSTSDGLMSAEDKAKLDSIQVNDNEGIYDVASWESDGLMAKEDKKKLDGIEDNANNYIHPNTPEIRHVTDAQITYWNAKASTDIATHDKDGLMSAEDKKKLDSTTTVTEEEKEYWNNKANSGNATQDKEGLMSIDDKRKLDSIDWNANNYIHPNNEGVRHVNDAEKTYWNSKADKKIVTNSENGLMAAIDKVKLDGIQEGANNYVHPEGPTFRHVTDEQIKFWDSKPSMKLASHTEDGLMSKEDKLSFDRLSSIVTDERIDYWDSKADGNLASIDKDGVMSAEDKKKLDSVEEGANNYIHPNDENTRHVSDSEKATWNAKADKTIATPDMAGLMAGADKKKLDTVQEGANYYVHPDDASTRHVTDTEKATWNAKADNVAVTVYKNGLMTSFDKQKLDGIEDNANNYIHPDTHPASMIEEDETHRFITDEDKAKLNSIDLVTIDKDGLMSKEDKAKLDQLTFPETHELSLVYSNWTDTEPYSQVLHVPGIKPEINAYIGINSTATVEEMVCAAEAKLRVSKVEQDQITIIATGTKPDINIPVIIVSGSTVLVFEVNQYDNKQEYSDEVPTTGSHYQNEIVYSSKPVQTGCIGWVCIETGEPGKWQQFGALSTNNFTIKIQ